jgi:hypothetical protein
LNARPPAKTDVIGYLFQAAGILAFLPEGEIVIGMRVGEPFEAVEAIYPAMQAEPFGTFPEEIDPPALIDAEFRQVSRNVFVANFLQKAVDIFAFEANHGVMDALAPRMVFVPTAGQTDPRGGNTLVKDRFKPVFLVGDG